MKFIKSFLSFFGTITTAIVFIMCIHCLTADELILTRYTLLQILAAGFMTALATTVFFAVAEKLERHLIIGTIIHFLILCVIMVSLGIWFGWYDFSFDGVAGMVISVAIVYVLVYVISYIIMKKETDSMNKALKERNKDK